MKKQQFAEDTEKVIVQYSDNHCELFLVDGEGNCRLYDYKVNAFGSSDDTKKPIIRTVFLTFPRRNWKITLCTDIL